MTRKMMTVLVACGVFGGSVRARADVITVWSDYASQAVATAVAGVPCQAGAPTPLAGRPSQATTIDLAMVHLAMHDAVQAIERRYEPYGDPIWGASGSTAAAASRAARDVLAARFPLQTVCLDARYHAFLSAQGIPEDDDGVEAGRLAAAGIIARRANDGSFPVPAPPPFIGSTDPGLWRPTPPANAPMVIPWLANVRRFALDDDDRERLASKAPPILTSARYTAEYNEVKAIGALGSTSRTQAQTYAAYFFADSAGNIWNRAMRAIVIEQGLGVGDSARLLAVANMAAADALMTAWDCKNLYTQWRPITAIREADDDGNPDTVSDATWAPLIATPPYPDWSSGANVLSGAMSHSVALVLGTDHLPFTLTSNTSAVLLPPPNNVRSYTRISQAAADVVEARIYEGIHFRSSDERARDQGEFVAKRVFKCFLRPLHGEGGGRDCNKDQDAPND